MFQFRAVFLPESCRTESTFNKTVRTISFNSTKIHSTVLHRRTEKSQQMDRKTDKLVRRTAMIATVTASYFLLTADYGPQPNALDPIKNAILSAERAAKELIFGSKKKDADSDRSNAGSKEKI